jgi:DNA modification methylase
VKTNWSLHVGDALELMAKLPPSSFDLILADLPYEVTQNAWDSRISMYEFWSECWRLLVPGGPVICTAIQPFTSVLVTSQPKMFRHAWVWEKAQATGHLNANRAPMRAHEDVLVFCRRAPQYFPQKTTGNKLSHAATRGNKNDSSNYGATRKEIAYRPTTERFPRSVIKFPSDVRKNPISPTQKPVALMEYMLSTYSKPGCRVLDPTCGSGTTGVACIKTGRDFIGFDSDANIIEKAKARLSACREEA